MKNDETCPPLVRRGGWWMVDGQWWMVDEK